MSARDRDRTRSLQHSIPGRITKTYTKKVKNPICEASRSFLFNPLPESSAVAARPVPTLNHAQTMLRKVTNFPSATSKEPGRAQVNERGRQAGRGPELVHIAMMFTQAPANDRL
jgi:hypothetical protein